MEVKNIGSRGTLFTFYDLGIATNVYVIKGKHRNYMIDTYLGPDIMRIIRQYLGEFHEDTPVVVINTHSHWDHVWGNCFFSSSLIVSHQKCKEYMEAEGQKELEKYKEYQRGEITITFPNMTFTDKLCFEEDDLLLYYTPGHTDDSISVLDRRDRVLFAGDNLERPVPYLMSKDLAQYIRTLEGYLQTDAEIIMGGHTACEKKGLVEHNLDYVKRVLNHEPINIGSKEFEEYHTANMAWLKEHGGGI